MRKFDLGWRKTTWGKESRWRDTVTPRLHRVLFLFPYIGGPQAGKQIKLPVIVSNCRQTRWRARHPRICLLRRVAGNHVSFWLSEHVTESPAIGPNRPLIGIML